MEAVEALDREVIVERAEAVRVWLLGLGLSGRATGAIQRELGAIIDNDPGSYINGQRPLAGQTVADFIKELHSPNGGAVGRVKSVGDGVLKELRAAIPEKTKAPRSRRKAPAQAAEAKPSRRRRSAPVETQQAADGTAPVTEVIAPVPETAAPQVSAEASQTEAPQADAPPAAPRPRGRPKGSKKAAQNGAETPEEAPAPAQALVEAPVEVVADEQAAEPKRRRGRPRRSETPSAISPTTSTVNSLPSSTDTQAAPKVGEGDSALEELRQLWPSLHPHARRAVVLYVSDLLIEA